ncbi:TPA: ABC transporter ATP-binding protein [archaeon]|jgi:putative ABC transport system ATP-binding protein|uniref:ABC transporter ATP-binding protein n=1 Tax=Candidatus Undinarchaeum marinum TaxID=2756141 RepID=A0A832V8K7_9ARCH|nr:ABC transporter ATP-binding protein [Candidatus Undinarchaeum marinum]
MAEIMFKAEDVWKTYIMGDTKTHALAGASLEVKKGEYVSIIGQSGSGKSTLMHMLGCLDSPTSGKVFVEGRDVSKLSSNELARIRRVKLGFVFQSYNLVSGLTALENVSLPQRFEGATKEKAEKEAAKNLKALGLEDRMLHKPTELSGGQQQRVAIARALVNDPDAILADEPTGNLDSKTSREIVDLLNHLNSKKKKTLITITHDKNIAEDADRKIYIKDGKIQKSWK